MLADRLLAVFGSVIVHLVLVGILAFTMWESPAPPVAAVSKPIIQARAVDEATAMEPVRRREAEERRKKQEAERKRKAAEAEKKRKAEEKRKKLEAENKRKLETEKKRKAELKRKQEEAEKKRLADEKRKQEEAERKRIEEEDRRLREEELKKQMAAEAERLAEEERQQFQRQNARAMEQYRAAISSRIQSQWQRPPGMPQDFICKVWLKQIPSGDVMDVRVIESCGNATLDRSVEVAVRKASPLPLPTPRELFDAEVVITFVPR